MLPENKDKITTLCKFAQQLICGRCKTKHETRMSLHPSLIKSFTHLGTTCQQHNMKELQIIPCLPIKMIGHILSCYIFLNVLSENQFL